jgi:putative lipoic acid-binding regulatory protein
MASRMADPEKPEKPEQPSLLKFPCEFPMKIVGRREDGFAQLVAEIVRRHATDFRPETIEMRTSKNGRYLSLTVTIAAKSREQLDGLYVELSKHPMVMMVL